LYLIKVVVYIQENICVTFLKTPRLSFFKKLTVLTQENFERRVTFNSLRHRAMLENTFRLETSNRI
jgi:hypothetical protein